VELNTGFFTYDVTIAELKRTIEIAQNYIDDNKSDIRHAIDVHSNMILITECKKHINQMEAIQ